MKIDPRKRYVFGKTVYHRTSKLWCPVMEREQSKRTAFYWSDDQFQEFADCGCLTEQAPIIEPGEVIEDRIVYMDDYGDHTVTVPDHYAGCKISFVITKVVPCP